MKNSVETSDNWSVEIKNPNSPGLISSVALGIGSAGLLAAPQAQAIFSPSTGDIQVNTNSSSNRFGGRRAQSVAVAPDGDFVVVWVNNASYSYEQFSDDVFARLFDANGTPLIGEITVGEGRDPSVATDGDGNFVVGWQARYSEYSYLSEVVFRTFDSDGAPTSSIIEVEPGFVGEDGRHGDIDVAMDPDGNIAVAWERNSNYDTFSYRGQTIATRTFSAAGSATSAVVMVSDGPGEGIRRIQEPAVAMDANGDFAVSWERSNYSYANTNTYYQRTVRVRPFNADATPKTAAVVAWTDPLSTGGSSTRDPDVAMNSDGVFAVSFDERPYGSPTRNVFMRVYNANGTPRTGLVNVNAGESSQDASIAMGGNRIAVAWHDSTNAGPPYYNSNIDVYYRGFDLDGNPLSGPTRANLDPDDRQDDPSVGMDTMGTTLAIAWEDTMNYDYDSQNVFARVFDAPGEAVPVPAMNKFSLTLMAGLTGLLGWFGFRRRHQASAGGRNKL